MKLELWERAVKEQSGEAFRFGPPNWLVNERKRQGEDHLAAAERIKAEYFPQGVTALPRSVTKNVTVTTPVTTEAVTEDLPEIRRVCEMCGKPILSRKLCNACRMKLSRARKHE